MQPALPEFGVKFSSFSKLLRITAWISRFLKKARKKETYLFKPYLNFFVAQSSQVDTHSCKSASHFHGCVLYFAERQRSLI